MTHEANANMKKRLDQRSMIEKRDHAQKQKKKVNATETVTRLSDEQDAFDICRIASLKE